MSGETDRVVLNFHNSLLRQSDINLLKGKFWLNDQIISFCFEYFENVSHAKSTQYLFVAPEVTQCIKIVPEDDISIFLSPLNIDSRTFIFFALNDNVMDVVGGTHWSLLLYSRKENLFFHYDSHHGSNSEIARNFVEKIQKFFNAKNSKLEFAPSLQQSNGYDCGIHVICMVDKLINHIEETGQANGVTLLSYQTVKTKRLEILKIIKQLGRKNV